MKMVKKGENSKNAEKLHFPAAFSCATYGPMPS